MDSSMLRSLGMFSMVGACAVALSLSACSSDNSSDTGNTPQDGGTNTADTGTNNTGDTGINPQPDSGTDAGSGAPDSGHDAGPAPMCDPDFDMTDACDSTLTGSWTYVAGCSNDTSAYDQIRQACPGATIMNGARTSGGTLVFNANGTFTRMIHETATTNFTIPAQCNLAGCGTIETLIEMGGADATCTANGGGCDCTATDTIHTDDDGTYTTAGGVITATPTGGQAGNYMYCVTNDSALRYRGQPGSPHNDFTSYVLTKD